MEAERPHEAPLQAPPAPKAPKAQERTQQQRAKVLEQQVRGPSTPGGGQRQRRGGPAPPAPPAGALPGWEGERILGQASPAPPVRGEDSPPVRGHPCDVSRRCLAGSSCSRGGPAAVPESGGESSGGSGDEVVTKSDRASGVWLPCPPHARVPTHTHAHVHMHTRTRAHTHRRTCQGRPSGSTLSETSFCR